MADKSIGDFLGGALRGAGDKQAEARAATAPSGFDSLVRSRETERYAAVILGFSDGLARKNTREDYREVRRQDVAHAAEAVYSVGLYHGGGQQADPGCFIHAMRECGDLLGFETRAEQGELTSWNAKALLEHAFDAGRAFAATEKAARRRQSGRER